MAEQKRTIRLQIDGKLHEAAEGESVLDAARRAGIEIPTLCHHDALEPAGACRLCTVEITHKEWGGWKGLVTSCLYPVEEGLQVTTENDEIRTVRRTMIDLLLARCPKSDFLKKLAREHGISRTSWRKNEEDTLCILCGLCVRVCAVKGCHAIGAAGRGIHKTMDRPFGQPPPDCIGCASCAHICPTGHITYKDRGGVREIWGHEFAMANCTSCGRPLMPEKQQAYEAAKSGLDPEYLQRCPECSEKKTVETIRSAFIRKPGEAAG
jgi:NADH dehydrogenase/NADH:ubiquinone oxidoreductase subunit G